MSLSAWEQQALDSIKNRLAGSDPELAAMLATFTQLTTGEEMPVAEEITAGSQQANRLHVRRFYQRLDLRWGRSIAVASGDYRSDLHRASSHQRP